MVSSVLSTFILPTTRALSITNQNARNRSRFLEGKQQKVEAFPSALLPRVKRCITFREIRGGLRCNCQLSSDIAPATSAAYGILLFCGGLSAYARTGSKGSLIGGLAGAVLMSTAYFLMQASETTEIGYALAFGSVLLFAAVFGIRTAATRKIFPAGFLFCVSVGALTVLISPYLQD